jgi:hypothetical protein
MRRLCLACILLVAAFGQWAISSKSQTPSQDSYSMAMKDWEKSQKLTITPKAQDLISYAFEQNKSKLTEFGGERVWKGSTRTLNQTVVTYYLSDLRDLKVSSGGFSRSEWKGRSIEASDVEAYPFRDFLTKLDPVLNGRKGELHVISDPTGASIQLDGAPRGNTEKITVESAGDHRIVVKSKSGGLQCEDKVNIPDGGSVTFHCP